LVEEEEGRSDAGDDVVMSVNGSKLPAPNVVLKEKIKNGKPLFSWLF
jgi:hypothetical protein